MNISIDRRIFNEIYFPSLFDYSHRFECHKGSAGSGKSYFVTQKVIIKAVNSKRRVLVMRKVGATIKESTWQLFIDVLQKFQIYSKCKVNKSDFTIELPNGSVFVFKSLDDPEKIKSITGITDVVVEEATEFTRDDISQLILRLRANVPDCQMYFMFNPISKENYTYTYFKFNENEEFETMRIREYGDTIIFCTTYKDNKFLDKFYIQTLEDMAETNPYYYSVYVLGKFASLDKLVYNNWVIETFDYKEILKQFPHAKAIFGLDFGYVNDPSAFICAIVDDIKKDIYIFDEIYEKHLLNNEIAGRIISKGFSKEIIVADSAEQKSIEEIKQFGISRIRKCRKGKGSILQGIQKIQQYRLIIHTNCIDFQAEVKNYSWKKNKQTGEYINEPTDKFNHLQDALRYAIQSVKKAAKFLNIKL